MKKRMVLPLLVLLISVLIAVLVSGTVFTPTASPSTLKTNGLSQIINFTIRNDNTTSNITQVNFTLPLGITFVSGTNSTNATGWIFNSSSSSANWTNLFSIGIINLSSSAWFAFQVNTPLVFTNVNFTVTTVDVAGVVNSTNVSITVEPDAVSNNREFSAFPSIVYLNWTNNYISNVTFIANQSSINNITLEIFNRTNFVANYSQTNPSGTYCEDQFNFLIIRNSSGINNNITEPINGSANYNNANFTLTYDTSSGIHPCSPGRYWIGNLMIRNYTNSSQNLNISVILDVPISPNSTSYPLNLSTGIGRFAGTIPANASTYHSYYFNATSMNYTFPTNITSVVINLTGWTSSQDIDVFLVDNSGNLMEKSINKSSTAEWLVYNYLPISSQTWEIRIYGNSTNTSGIPYSGNIIFSTLNLTNNTGHQIFSINFGNNMNVTNTSNVSLTLTNMGSINFTNIAETKELFYIQRFGRSGSQNISFLASNSSIATKVKVSLNWTGSSNYSFNVYKPDGSLILSSMNKYLYANVTNVVQEEYDETTNIGSAAGYWRIDIRNNTNANDAYNVTTYIYVNTGEWINSSFNASGISLNATGVSNYTYNFTVNLTVPNSTLDGKYEGYIQYKASSGATLRIPIEFTTKSGMLLINNTIGSSTVRIDENIGANLTKVLNITFNNTGNYDLSISHTNSSNLTYSTKNISFTFNSPSSIPAGGNGTINITINIDTTNTGDLQGLYEGYIRFNTNASYPYRNFTLIIRVNLTDLLLVSFEDISPTMTKNTTAENVSLKVDLTYLNGSSIAVGMGARNSAENGTSNFSSAWLISSNVSSYRIPTSGSLFIFNKSGWVYNAAGCEGKYCINITIPADSVGGTYAVHLFANYSRTDNKIFGGYGISSNQVKYLTINNTGLQMSTNATGCSFGSSCNPSTITLNPGNATTIYVNVTNYGSITSAGTSVNNITFSESCTGYDVSAPTYSNCPSTSFAPTGNSSSCIVYWTVTANTSRAGATACVGNIVGSGYWFDTRGINVTITVTDTTGGSTTTTTTSGTTTTTTTTSTSNLEFTKAETLIFIQQNSSNTTEVGIKNTGNTTQNVTFSIIDFDQSWFTLNATTANLLSGKTAGFKITFGIGDAAVKDYTGQYYAIGTNKLTKNFTLRVLPAPAKQTEINDTLALYKADAVNLEVEINKSRAKGMNVTLAEQKLADLKSKIEQAENYIKAGDYFSAYQLFIDIKTLMDDTKSELAKAKAVVEAGKKRFRWIIIGVGAAVIGIGVLAYMFWPTKPGYHQEKGFTPKKEENLWDNLKEKWEKIKKGK